MKRPYNHKRLVGMRQMLLQMAQGNFSGRIPLSEYDDEIETLVVMVNMVAEELKEGSFQIGMINSRSAFGLITPATFILDGDFRITNVSAGALSILGYGAEEMLEQDIKTFLIPSENTGMTESQARQQYESRLSGESFRLEFLNHGRMAVPVKCTISRLAAGGSTVLNFIEPFVRDLGSVEHFVDLEDGHQGSRKTDARLLQEVHDYILANLNEPLPSVKELAKQFGTNDHKLKEGFRFFFHNSIYHFYLEERLHRARLMISATEVPLKMVAQYNGFNSYPNFSRAFKKLFGIAPKELARKG